MHYLNPRPTYCIASHNEYGRAWVTRDRLVTNYAKNAGLIRCEEKLLEVLMDTVWRYPDMAWKICVRPGRRYLLIESESE